VREFTYTVTDDEGIHIRPAGLIVKKMKMYRSDVTITHGEDTADLKKLFALMGLGVQKGETVVVKANGEDEDEAISIARAFFEENL